MSADNWAVCPRCLDRAKMRVAELVKRADDAYGAVPIEEYMAMRAEAEVPVDKEGLRTFREDYEIGLTENTDGDYDPTVIVRYKGHCGVCGLNHEIKIDEAVG